jgi:hypothetical protein
LSKSLATEAAKVKIWSHEERATETASTHKRLNERKWRSGLAVGVTDMRKGFEGVARLGEGATRQGHRGSGNGAPVGSF